MGASFLNSQGNPTPKDKGRCWKEYPPTDTYKEIIPQTRIPTSDLVDYHKTYSNS
jgi:hypothetical protein